MLKNSHLDRCIVFFIVLINFTAVCQAQKKTDKLKAKPLVIVKLQPPKADFFAKYVDCMGIPIMSSTEVNDSALLVAGIKIRMMLAHIPDAAHNLTQWNTEFHVIGKNQQTSDLPEFRLQKGVKYVDNLGNTTDIDARTRGMGGIYTSCGEENLLSLPGDRYPNGQDICFHEFAHDIMDFGLDSTLRNLIRKQYKKAIAAGLWKDAYAAVNESEYFAELSMWYFGKHGEYLKNTKEPVAGPGGLKGYDTGGYELLDSIYSGKMKIEPIQVVAAKKILAAQASVAGVQKSKFILINHTSKKLNIFWIAFDGKLVAYGNITPYNAVINETFLHHVWELEDEAGKSIGYFSIDTPYSKIEIN